MHAFIALPNDDKPCLSALVFFGFSPLHFHEAVEDHRCNMQVVTKKRFASRICRGGGRIRHARGTAAFFQNTSPHKEGGHKLTIASRRNKVLPIVLAVCIVHFHLQAARATRLAAGPAATC